MILISNLKIGIDDDMEILAHKIRKKLKLKDQQMKFKILRESVDARKKGRIDFVYQVMVEVKDEKRIIQNLRDDNISLYSEPKQNNIKYGRKDFNKRVAVIGSGPCGLFAAYTLALHGLRPILIERGKDVDSRSEDVENFWKKGILNPISNVQFGEGGAGTFSDGKLTTRIKDIRVGSVLDTLHKMGAPDDIIYAHRPHIGTDILRNVVKRLRNEIIALGGEVRFEARLEKIEEQDGHISAILIDGERINTEAVVLATGHSARDTYKMLDSFGVKLIPKPFAVGFRIEHPQKLINKAQYKENYNHPRLGSADYQLTYKSSLQNRSAYTFCMCPGGLVIGSSSAENELVVNGMSFHARNLENANSALVVNVTPQDFNPGALGGIEFQQKYERLAYDLGGGGYKAPVQRVDDFMNSIKTATFGSIRPSYTPGFTGSDLSSIYPAELTKTLKEAIIAMDKKLHGFAHPDAILTGVETRSSSAVRIVRDEDTMESVSLKGLYPAGEGSGYAGGIVTSAIDGIKAAEKIIAKYKKQI